MKYVQRGIEQAVKDMASWFPIVSVTGPRQSGKSTLIKEVFRDYEYVNLEDQETFKQATEDPVGFINNRPNRLIIDEAQRAPKIFSQIQVKSDEYDTTGQYIISGSQNFTLLRTITQSLAGRVGICRLFPLSYSEIVNSNINANIDEIMYNGGYPRFYGKDIPHDVFFDGYIETNILKDTTGAINGVNFESLKDFIHICSLYAGNLLNITNLARQAEISRPTAMQWLNILQTNYILFELHPYFNNELKSLTKTPKLYFYDTGLLTHLLGIQNKNDLLTSKYLGQVYENFIISETIKKYYNANLRPNLYFYRDNSKVEVDLLDLSNRQDAKLIEIKSSETFNSKYSSHLISAEEKLSIPIASKQVVMRIKHSYKANSIDVVSGNDYLLRKL